MGSRRRRNVFTSAALGALTFAIAIAPIFGPLAMTAAARKSRGSTDVKIRVLSNRADLISGGNAYVEIVLPPDASMRELDVIVGSRDVTGSFKRRTDGRILGVVRGLRKGRNLMTAILPDGRGATLTITNHPKGGPVFSGRQVRPWICETQASGLEKAKDKKCNAPTRYEYFYKSSDPGTSGFQPYDRDNPPDTVATTETDQGKEVPFIVRRETGTQNRGVYQVAVLFNPKKPWRTPWQEHPGWNHKLFYPFGASCGTQYRQAEPTDVMDEEKLGLGFMAANSSLNVLGNNCNTITSAESVMMLKEHIVDHYGEIRYTIGQGCSGGSIGQHMVANSYPGLLQGIQPNCSFPDVYSTGNEVVDCHLLVHYYDQVSPHLWASDQQRAAVNGHQTQSSCVAWEALFSSVPDPEVGCALPEKKTYNAETNPKGTRCTTFDMQQALWGRRGRSLWIKPEKKIDRGFARTSFDNIGLQYGLDAVNSGEITTEQFVDLNEKIGGVDVDFNFIDGRTKANPGTQRILYRSGQLNDASNLDQVAIIDLRGTSNQEIHTDFHSYALRHRLDKAHGHHDNHVIWTGPAALVGDLQMLNESFFLLDEWLTAVEADSSDLPLDRKIVLNKPAAAVDACWISGNKVTDMNKCRAAFPYFGAPRIAAGGPESHDVNKCRQKPLEKSDYTVTFTDAQWDRLKEAFPFGVCDYNATPVGKVPTAGWLDLSGGPGGRALGRPPRSEPFGT